MDHIILGLLLLSSRTIYQLRERIGKGLHLMYSSSTGSIQAAIKKLQQCGYISFEEVVDKGKYKKIYSITEAGRQHFLAWVNSPIELQNVKIPELVKVYFMGFSEERNREAAFTQYLSSLREQFDTLNAICEEADHLEVSEEHKDILFYQLATARYGRSFLKFHIEWYENLLEEIRSKKHE